MAFPSDPALRVLLGLRLGGFSSIDKIAALTTVDPDVVARTLEEFGAQGLASFKDGRMTGWVLTPAGRAEGEARLRAQLDAAGCRDALDAAYRRFLALNGQMLAVCTDWQMRDAQTLNDHSDADYDAKVVARLVEIDAAVQPICAELADLLDRYGDYGARLTYALERARAGEIEWFTKPMIPSYHTVWFELHEDLLATLNIDRASEAH